MDHKQTLELIKMLEHVVLPEDSGVHEECIYRAPPNVRQVNPEAYTPKVVSIGPFHNPRNGGNFFEPMQRDNILVPMEELKLKYLKAFLRRTNVSIEQLNLKIKELGSKITRCYPWPFDCYSNDFFTMILVDACFIIEHFLRHYSYRYAFWPDDPILSQSWLLVDIRYDLIILENQLPFFLLEDIYNLTKMNIEFPSFLEITYVYLSYFNNTKRKPEGVYPKHFIDILRTSMLPLSIDPETPVDSYSIEHLYSATQLSEAGLVFEVIPEGFLDLEYKKGVLTMPCFKIDDGTERCLRNILAFEECQYHGKQHITQYFKILDFLINTEKDVNILIDKKIIVNLMGDANAVVAMVNNLCNNISLPNLSSKYVNIFKSLNGFYENPRNKYKAIFIHEYFNTPWKIASTTAAVLLLLFTLIQTICSVISLA